MTADAHSAAAEPESAKPTDPVRILLELRPALEGFAGIPQETRLLFRGLRQIEGVAVQGLVQTFTRNLVRGSRDAEMQGARIRSPGWRINRYSRVIVSMTEQPLLRLHQRVFAVALHKLREAVLSLRSLLGACTVRLSNFETRYFEDFVWRTFFAKTLSARDFVLVTEPSLRVCSVPWNRMHRAGLNSMLLLKTARYPRLEVPEHDIFIAQTPYPARLTGRATLVVRYHDAVPVLMPHTIPDKSVHQASHFNALAENVRAGAWFACISSSTRDDLLRMFPEAADRAVTIHNMVSDWYFPEDSRRERVAEVIRTRLYEGVNLQPEFSPGNREAFYGRCLGAADLRYLLIVSTIEPRKNHARLLAAWEVLKAEVDPALKLVVVGTLGWDYKQLTASFRTWIDRGDLFMLNAVPAADLRLLYRHALATVCPSLGEGFDYSGVEAMACGGVAVASDIPVHREIYEDASEYFDPYSTASLVQALRRVLYDDGANERQQRLRELGAEISARYRPERILPQWWRFIERLRAERRP